MQNSRTLLEDLRQQIREELRAEVRAEMRATLTEELRTELTLKVDALDVLAELTALRKELAEFTARGATTTVVHQWCSCAPAPAVTLPYIPNPVFGPPYRIGDGISIREGLRFTVGDATGVSSTCHS